MEKTESNSEQIITEGLATVRMHGNVFYNPVQEFNRDLSLSVLSVFAEEWEENMKFKNYKYKERAKGSNDDLIINDTYNSATREDITANENGITILEALSASGLRSIRYAKEIPKVKKILANDISQNAVESIKENIESNGVENIVETSHSDAIMLMYTHRQYDKFTAIDLDPYGCPTVFLDAAVQAVSNGGLLLVTATDMAVLAGNCPETCYVKYGAVSLRISSCHEMALRILLQCIEAHANKHGRYIEPLLSVSADFYIRVFVRVHQGAAKCKFTTSKLSMVFNCIGCSSFTLQPLGMISAGEKETPHFYLPAGPAVKPNCDHCGQKHYMGGPIWSGPLHSKEFVSRVLQTAPQRLGTWKRIEGVLSVILEELIDAPLYYTLKRLTSVLHCETPPILLIRSAILNAGYEVSFSHANRISVKTNAPSWFIWDIFRCWVKMHPVKPERLKENSPASVILTKPITNSINFSMHPNANPESRKQGFVRFQENPTPHWGPGTRATAMVGEKSNILKSKKNQGKRKLDKSDDSQPVVEKKLELEALFL